MKVVKFDKGVAGLSVLLSLVTMLFIIGLLVMIFALMGAGLSDSVKDNGQLIQETIFFTNGTGTATSVATLPSIQLSEVLVCEGE